MRVRMLTTAAGPDGVYMAGEVWEMPDRLALAMVAAGFAVSQDGARGPEVEMAVLAPPANADARPRGSKRIPAGK